MKISRILVTILLFTAILFACESCVVLVKEDNGNHKGWYKNPKNPHNAFTNNPGHSKRK
jgi:hypothetical protein